MKTTFNIIIIAIMLFVIISSFLSHWNILSRSLLLLFFPSKFIDLSTQDTIKRELKTNQQFKERYDSNDSKWKKEMLQRFHSQFLEMSTSLRNSFFQAILTAFKVVIVALGLAYFLSRYISLDILNIIQIVSTFVIFIAVIGTMGRSIETVSGETLPEVVNEFWSVLLNWVGILCFFFTQFCPFFKNK